MIFLFSNKNKFKAVIDKSKNLGLREQDVIWAYEFLDAHEYGLLLDLLITQLYEFEIPIDFELYNDIENLGKTIGFEEKDYVFLKELINNNLDPV